MDCTPVWLAITLPLLLKVNEPFELALEISLTVTFVKTFQVVLIPLVWLLFVWVVLVEEDTFDYIVEEFVVFVSLVSRFRPPYYLF